MEQERSRTGFEGRGTLPHVCWVNPEHTLSFAYSITLACCEVMMLSFPTMFCEEIIPGRTASFSGKTGIQPQHPLTLWDSLDSLPCRDVIVLLSFTNN